MMDKVTKNDASNKIMVESKDVNKESNSGSRYNVRVRSESIPQTGRSCEQRDSGSEITECSKNNPLLSGSSLQRNINQLSSGKDVFYKDAFEDEDEDEAVPPSSLSDQHRTDDEYVPSNTSHGARPKTRSYSRPTQFSMGKGACSNSGWNALTINSVKNTLSEIEKISNFDAHSIEKNRGVMI
ncbi:MAG: hypothetical protein KAG53_11030 [Endozoicomonadaceae bacterium]|nr:hypothetical protein [Endozoicomonadaceae bacterium]